MAYAFVGLLGGNAALLLFLLQNAVTSVHPFLVFVLLIISHGHIDFNDYGTFTGTSRLWALSILVSAISFVLYAALLREES
jgi:hypothetical protein